MLEQLRAQIRAKLDERQTASDAVKALLEAPTSESRDLNEEETSKFTELKTTVKTLDGEIDEMKTRMTELEDMDKRDAERADLAASIQPNTSPQPVIRMGSEPTTYGQGSGNSFFADAYASANASQTGFVNPSVQERLSRHQAEVRSGAHGSELRAVATGDFSSLVVPQYLPEMFAANLHAGRVTADLASPHTLPVDGETITIPFATDGTLVAAQTTQNSAVAENDYDTDDLVINVRTYAGQQNVSRQALERGRGVDEIIFADLAGDYVSRVNRDVISGAGSNGTHLGILGSGVDTVTASDTDGFAIIRKIGEAIANVNGSRLVPADAIVMHPRRWGYLSVHGDAGDRPLVVVDGPAQNAFGSGAAAAVSQRVGSILGVPVYTDPSIPTGLGSATNEDRILVMRRGDLHLWEEGVAPRQLRFEETLGGNLTVKMVLYGYSAFTAKHRPEGVSVIGGAGLVTPVF